MGRKSTIPERLRRQVQERARGRCEYCLIHEADMYYPREQRWHRHFRLNGALIEGITASGRATVALLRLNDHERVAFRLGLIDLGYYPPR